MVIEKNNFTNYILDKSFHREPGEGWTQKLNGEKKIRNILCLLCLLKIKKLSL